MTFEMDVAYIEPRRWCKWFVKPTYKWSVTVDGVRVSGNAKTMEDAALMAVAMVEKLSVLPDNWQELIVDEDDL
jgi:hypothetical protein